MKACELRALLNQIPDDAELKFEFEQIFLDNCIIENYPEKYLNGYPPFYFLKPSADESRVIKD